MKIIIAALPLVLCLCIPAIADSPDEHRSLTEQLSATEKVTLSLQNADIKHLVEWASEYISKTIIVHPSVQGSITVIAGEPIPANQVGQVFQSILQVHGFVAIESDTSIKILPETLSAASESNIIYKQPDGIREHIVTTIIPVEHISAEELSNKLKPFLTKAAQVAVFRDSNLLLISDRSSTITKVMNVIKQIDKPNGFEVHVRQMINSSAVDVVARLKEILPSQQGGTSSSGPLFTADKRSNSIIYAGTPTQTETMLRLIGRLDLASNYNDSTQVIFLDYAKASTLTDVLSGMAEGIRSRNQALGNPNSDITIDVSEEQNALVITADSSVIQEMRAIIAQLDRRRLQVLVEALIVEVNEDDAKDIGVEWRALIGDNGAYAGNSALTKNLPVPELPGIGPGLTLGFLNLDETSFIIRALETSGAGNILSKPTIVAMDNEEATILVGENVPFITGSSTGSASSTGNPFQTITRQDIGITLAVKPQINRNRSITLEIEQKVEGLNQAITNTADVVTNKREIKTTVLIEHDQILVLGGLIRDELQDNTQKVPLLGDIPLLGRFFRGTSTSVVKRNLMVFIHPRIIDSAADWVQITNRQYEQISNDQENINNKVDRFLIQSSPPNIRNNQFWALPEGDDPTVEATTEAVGKDVSNDDSNPSEDEE